MIAAMLFLGAPAWGADPPLALPAEPDPAYRPPPVAPDPAVADRVDALYRYRSRRLQLRGHQYYTGGGTTVVHTGWWSPYRGPFWGIGTSYVLTDPLVAHDSWAVFQGSQRLTVPVYLDLVDDEAAEALSKRIARNRQGSQGLLVLGLGGLGAVLVGSFGGTTASSYDEARQWSLVTNVGLGGLAVGFLGSSVAAGAARKLRHDFTATLDYTSTLDLVEAHNDKLRTELGLSEGDVRERGER